MSTWFIWTLIAMNAGGAAFCALEGKHAVALLLAAGVMANVSGLMMARGMS